MITVKTTIQAPIEKVWDFWTEPRHITKWNFATEEWCCPSGKNDLKKGGVFSWRMEAKDGSLGFDFSGVYEKIIDGKLISYKIADGRNVKITFEKEGNGVT